MPISESPDWEGIAAWYDNLVSGGSGPHETALLCTRKLCGDLSGLRTLDLACGQGLATRALAAGGSTAVTGVDSSPSLISIAKEREKAEPLGIDYVVDDAQTLEFIHDSSVDLVNCQLGLMDIPDLSATLSAVARVLVRGGSFVFVIGHPAFLAPNATRMAGKDGKPGVLIQEYLEERFWRSSNPNGVRRVGNYHRPLSVYLNGLLSHGFALQAVEEPKGSKLLVARTPLFAEVPIFLGVRAGLI